ncbi:hypothetical protein B0T10DRAFT_519294 [Thelonectria olida]|uniref:Uncharacterized protein n=1 Tax=Thelonectria olida TaxID=1576542 RepID=A0A9P8VXY8_9HYPO|nr:hypothetical protein B0T10DRAFT_519294 [Thelonectria olida]
MTSGPEDDLDSWGAEPEECTCYTSWRDCPVLEHGAHNDLSYEEMGFLTTWVRNSEDPAPTFEDAKQKAKLLFGKNIRSYREYNMRRVLHTRTLNGPPKRDGDLTLPGYRLPVTHKIDKGEERHPFLLGLGEKDWDAPTLTNCEVFMLKFIEEITNRPEWWRKVREPDIVLKWKQEVLEMPWTGYQRYAVFSETMADACFKELNKKAEIYERTGLIPVMDYAASVIKSDTILTNDLKEALKTAVTALEHVPEPRQDWKPGSDGKVLNLIDPSLWPLVYGSSKISSDKRIPLHSCIDYSGMGAIIPEPVKPRLEDPELRPQYFDPDDDPDEFRAISTRFQWLPCDVNLTGGRPRIESYINSLHPFQHANLYSVIETFIEKSLPAWDIVCRSSLEEFNVQRLEDITFIKWQCGVPEVCGDWCANENRPGRIDEDWQGNGELLRRDEAWWQRTHKLSHPEPKLNVDDLVKLEASDVRETGFFNNAPRIQVIVKLANIHLTPEKPTYDGGEWHVEGLANEHICATALYYYDCENITDSGLAFRTHANGDILYDLGYKQGDVWGIEGLYAIEWNGSMIQDIGSVLIREGRSLFYPNVYQRRIEPFELADKTRPGHQKMLALFLVDPLVPIISTANVPPQQRDWWADSVRGLPLLDTLPSEIMNMVIDNVDFPMGEAAAKEIREELIAERRAVVNEVRSWEL